jgi:glycyl-tRNA synthetase
MYSFLKEQGYIWDSGLSGHVVYGPKGKNLKNKLENYLRYMLQQKSFMEIESPLIYKKEVWESSGHWDKFQDPIIYTQSKKCFRLDKLVEEFTDKKFETLTDWNEIKAILEQMNTNVVAFKKDQLVILDNIEYKSLMMKTLSSHSEAGLRPETATATYQNFEDCFYLIGKTYPVKVFQLGKSFRNEIATRHNLIRGREFTQLESQIILPVDQKDSPVWELTEDITTVVQLDSGEMTWEEFQDKFKLPISYLQLIKLTYKMFIKLDLKPTNVRLRRHLDDEKAFYALDAWDIEINLKDIGWTEVAGIHDRGCYDLEKVLTGKLKKKGIPNVLEMAIGIDRLIYSILDNLFEKKDVQDGKSMLTIPYFLAPTQVCVLPLIKNKEEICVLAKKIHQMVKPHFVTDYDEKGGIGKRYLKNAIKGVPYCITIDFDSLENNDVTVRDRNTEEQVRVKIDDLVNYLVVKLALLSN